MNFRSEKINEIVAMLIKARPELLKIEHDKKGNRGSYISRDRILSASNSILAPYGGQVIPVNRHKDGVGMLMGIMLSHGESEQWIISDYSLDEFVDYSQGDPNHKKGGSITYGVRYTIGAMLGISIGDDDYKPADNKPTSKLTPKQVAELSDLFVGHSELKARVFKSEGVSRWEDVLQEAIPDILAFYDKETNEQTG